MPSLQDFGARLQIPIEEVIKIGEKQVLNVNSQIYKALSAKIGQKLATAKATQDTIVKKHTKPRVYIQHAVAPTDRFSLVAEYPQWDIHFSAVDMRAAAKAHAVFVLVAEEMITQLSVKKGNMLVYGISTKQIVMRNRRWIHLCVPGHMVEAQVEFYADDRAISAMVNSTAKKGKEPGLARSYIAGQAGIHCTQSHLCDFQARASVMMLHKTDTNFRQLAHYMNVHGSDLLFFSVPGSKHMEMGTSGEFPELDAYVFPTNEGKNINIAYKNDTSLDMSYTYTNYLELIARVQVIVGNRCFRKEFVARRLGMLIYKVTAFDKKHYDHGEQIYRSWIDPGYKDKYMVYSPVLKPGGNVNRSDDFELVSFPIEKSIVDVVYDHSLRVSGVKDMAREIERRLFTRTSNHILMNQILNSSSALTVSQFDMLAMVIYCKSYMQKFKDGTSIAALAPQARDVAQLARAGMPSLLLLYFHTMMSRTMAPLETVKTSLRNAYYKLSKFGDLPMPDFTVAPGFVEYTDKSSSNPRFKGWMNEDGDPTTGFTTCLPGYDAAAFMKIIRADYTTMPSPTLPSVWEFVTGNQVYESTDEQVDNKVISGFFRMFDGLYKTIDEMPDFSLPVSEWRSSMNAVDSDTVSVYSEDADEDFAYDAKPVQNVRFAQTLDDNIRYKSDATQTLAAQNRQVSNTPKVDQLVEKITNDNGLLRSTKDIEYVRQQPFADVSLPMQVQAAGSADVIADLTYALASIFPESALMNTTDFEAEKAYGPLDIMILGIRTKIDLSKLEALKPESVYKPLVNSHVQPNVKNNLVNMLLTIEKRNANTPNDSDPLDIDMLWRNAWRASLNAYYIRDTDKILNSLPYIGPSEQSVREWVSKLSEDKINKLLTESEIDGFAFNELISGAVDNQFMLKGKLKPKLDASYSSNIAMPQSLQYDQSGKLVAVYTPVFSQKVAREQSVLKDNIMVLQRKSKKDVEKFLSAFDWRPNSKGARRYLEGDYTQFDKSQSDVAATLHYRKCNVFGMLMSYKEFFEIVSTSRTVSSAKAGVKQWLRYQHASGFPNTLDRNNDVNMLAMAELLDSILSIVEFAIFMGDDFVVAVRGIVDISKWESEVNRKYNLNIKLAIHDHGYICSMDIVHLPDGKSRVVSDVIKRAVMLTQQGHTTDAPFDEMFVSYADITDGIQDSNVQLYLQDAIPRRINKVLPGVTPDAIAVLCRVHTKLRSDYKAFRSLYSTVTTLHHY